MINFGPVTVAHNGTSLGKTFGGGSLDLLYETQNNVTSYGIERTDLVTGVTGTLSFFQWNSDIIISDDTDLLAYNNVVLTGRNIIITLPRCKIMLSPEIGEIGTNTQKGIKMLLHGTVAEPDTEFAGQVLRIEST
jgi:hypothetical protein